MIGSFQMLESSMSHLSCDQSYFSHQARLRASLSHIPDVVQCTIKGANSQKYLLCRCEHDHMFTLAAKAFKGTIIQSRRGLSRMQ